MSALLSRRRITFLNEQIEERIRTDARCGHHRVVAALHGPTSCVKCGRTVRTTAISQNDIAQLLAELDELRATLARPNTEVQP